MISERSIKLTWELVVYLAVVILALAVYAYFWVPNKDDGINTFHIRNTIDFTRPFFNDHHGTV